MCNDVHIMNLIHTILSISIRFRCFFVNPEFVASCFSGDPSGRVTGTDFAVGLAAVQLAAAAVICIVASAIDSISAPKKKSQGLGILDWGYYC